MRLCSVTQRRTASSGKQLQRGPDQPQCNKRAGTVTTTSASRQTSVTHFSKIGWRKHCKPPMGAAQGVCRWEQPINTKICEVMMWLCASPCVGIVRTTNLTSNLAHREVLAPASAQSPQHPSITPHGPGVQVMHWRMWSASAAGDMERRDLRLEHLPTQKSPPPAKGPNLPYLLWRSLHESMFATWSPAVRCGGFSGARLHRRLTPRR